MSTSTKDSPERAAQTSHLSQPAFSALIRTLEDAVGTRLFDRDTRSVQLTPEGRLLDDMGSAMGDLADHVERRKGRVRIAALPSLAAGWLPAVFAEFMQTWPGIRIDLDDALSDACIALVRSGQANFALAASGAAADSDLLARKLCTDRFHLVCRADHPLAHEARLTVKKIAPWPFVQMARNSSVRQALDVALHPLRLNAVFEVEHLATVMGLVEAGLGISVVPALTLFHFRRETLVTRPLPLPAQTLHDLVVARLGSLQLD